jgi:hypothetical protein
MRFRVSIVYMRSIQRSEISTQLKKLDAKDAKAAKCSRCVCGQRADERSYETSSGSFAFFALFAVNRLG